MIFSRFLKILTVAAFSSLVAGILLTLVQQFQVVPLILQAEVYEQAAQATTAAPLPESNETGFADSAHSHIQHRHIQHRHVQVDSDESWQPEDGLQRHLFTASTNVVIALGFALLLGAVMTLRTAKLNWRSGLLWGLGGYVVFFIAPSLGLPPEVPGTQAAELVSRQLWWVITVVFTASGLSLFVFNNRFAIKIIGAALLIVPHVIGVPQPEVHGGTAPAELVHAFILATVIANAVFWLSLGGLYGFFHQKLAN